MVVGITSTQWVFIETPRPSCLCWDYSYVSSSCIRCMVHERGVHCDLTGTAPLVVHTPSGGHAAFVVYAPSCRWKMLTKFRYGHGLSVVHAGGCAPLVVHTPSGGRAPFSGSRAHGNKLKAHFSGLRTHSSRTGFVLRC